MSLAFAAVLEHDTLERDFEPVVFEGRLLEPLCDQYEPIERIYLYAYREGAWRQVVLQVDERDDEGDYWNLDSSPGLLDENDEIVFMSNELGNRVPTSNWLAGTDVDFRYEVEVADPVDPFGKGWAYLYLADGIERDTTDYVDWDGSILLLDTDAFQQDSMEEYGHVIDGIIIKEAWGGGGFDIIDRAKMRNKLLPFGSWDTEEDMGLDYRGRWPHIDRNVRYICMYWISMLGFVDMAKITAYIYHSYAVQLTHVLKPIIPFSMYGVKHYFDFSPAVTDGIHYDNGGTDPNGDYNKDYIDGLGGGNPNEREPVMTWYETDSPTAGSWLLITDLSEPNTDRTMRYYNDGGYSGGGTGDGWEWGESGYEFRWLSPGEGFISESWMYLLPGRTEAEGPAGPEFEEDYFNRLEISGQIQLPDSVGVATPSGAPDAPASKDLYAAPNPFNPKTTISFNLPGPGRVDVHLRMYDLRGNLVDVLLEGASLPPGLHAVTWNGTSRDGRPLPSGVYISALEFAGSRTDGRLVLCR